MAGGSKDDPTAGDRFDPEQPGVSSRHPLPGGSPDDPNEGGGDPYSTGERLRRRR
jgi:hypothetical protein